MEEKAKGKYGTILIIEGDSVLVDAEEKIIREEFSEATFAGEAPAKYWLEKRFSVKELSEFAPLGFVIDTIEVVAPWSKAAKLYYDVIEAMRSVEGTLLAYAHASHFYPQGVCWYFIFGGLPKNKAPEEYYREIWSATMEATLKNGGAISHHQGIGRMREE